MFYGLECDLSSECSSRAWEECICILLLDKVAYRCSIRPRWLTVLLNSNIPLRISCPPILICLIEGASKSPTMTVGLSISPSTSISYCLVYFEAFSLENTHEGSLSPWRTGPIIIMQGLILSLIIFLALISALPDANIQCSSHASFD